VTPLRQEWSGSTLRLRIGPARGEHSVLPDARGYTLAFHAIDAPEQTTATCDGVRLPVDSHYDRERGTLTVRLPPGPPGSSVEVTLEGSSGSLQRHDDATRPLLAKLLKAFRCGSEAKRGLSLRLDEILVDFEALGAYRTALSDTQLRALLEVLLGAGMHVCEDSGEAFAVVWNNREDQRASVRWSVENRRTWDPQRRFRQEHGPAPHFARYPLAVAAGDGPVSLTLAYGSLLALNTRRGGGPPGSAPVSIP